VSRLMSRLKSPKLSLCREILQTELKWVTRQEKKTLIGGYPIPTKAKKISKYIMMEARLPFPSPASFTSFLHLLRGV